MTAEKWLYSLALCFMCVSSNDDFLDDYCETQTLSAPLGSSVLLPCNQSSLGWVSWVQISKGNLVNLTSEGCIQFLDHRNGRVKAFPNQGSMGNYSISIDELQNSDLGYYHCKQGHDCLGVQLVLDTGALSEEMKLYIYISVGVAAFILLSACMCCCMKCTSLCNDKIQNYVNNPVGARTEAVSASPEEPDRGPVNEQQRGADNLVYENDDHDPAYVQEDITRNNCTLPGFVDYLNQIQPTQSTCGNYPDLNQRNFGRTESKRTKQRFHRELISRLRQASYSQHYYVNQGELSRQQAASSQVENQHRGFRKNKTKDDCEYKNPIYNRSTDHLNHQ